MAPFFRSLHPCSSSSAVAICHSAELPRWHERPILTHCDDNVVLNGIFHRARESEYGLVLPSLQTVHREQVGSVPFDLFRAAVVGQPAWLQ